MISSGAPSWVRLAGTRVSQTIPQLLSFRCYLLPYAGAYVAVMAMLGLEALFTLVQPLVYRRLVDDVLGASARGTGYRLLALYLGLIAVLRMGSWLAGIFHDIFQARVLHGAAMDVENAIHSKLDTLPVSYHDRRAAGETLRHLYGDPGTVTAFLAGLLPVLTEVLVRGVTAWVIIAMTLWWAGLVALVPLLPIAAVGVWSARRFQGMSQVMFGRSKRLYMHVLDTLRGVRLVRVFGRVLQERERFQHLQQRLRKARLIQSYGQAWFSPVMSIMAQVGGVAVFIAGAVMLVTARVEGRADFTLGDLFMLMGYVWQLPRPMARLGQLVSDLGSAGAAAQRLRGILDEPDSEGAVQGVAIHPDRSLEATVVFDHVSFGYQPGQEVLREVSFILSPGEIVGLYGPNGSGKTTIANLLCGFYTPRSGRVLVGGVPAHIVGSVRGPRFVALAPQDAPLLHRTIRENLSYGRADASDAELWTALDSVRMRAVIKALPRGLDTWVGEGADILSAGQRQRLSLARAMVSSAQVVVMDEATSWIDVEDRDQIWAALRASNRQSSFLVISHHERLVSDVDRVLILEAGTVRSSS